MSFFFVKLRAVDDWRLFYQNHKDYRKVGVLYMGDGGEGTIMAEYRRDTRQTLNDQLIIVCPVPKATTIDMASRQRSCRQCKSGCESFGMLRNRPKPRRTNIRVAIRSTWWKKPRKLGNFLTRRINFARSWEQGKGGEMWCNGGRVPRLVRR